MDHLCYICLVFVMLSHPFIAALWSPTGKGLTSWLLFVMSYCDFVTFRCGILGLVWYLIVMIPGLCRLSYFIVIHCGLLFIWHCVKHGVEWNGMDSIPLHPMFHSMFPPLHSIPFLSMFYTIPIYFVPVKDVCASSKVVLHLKWSWHLFWSQIASKLVPAGIYYGTLSRL